jgi:hypothetical protein
VALMGREARTRAMRKIAAAQPVERYYRQPRLFRIFAVMGTIGAGVAVVAMRLLGFHR